MIFVTVGTELPFDRLIRAIDAWAGETKRTDVFAQIGSSSFTPAHIEFAQHLSPAEFAQRFAKASVIVAHAGMGTILSSLRAQKPIVVVPRRASLFEQRNDHQLATARRLHSMGKINVAFDEKELRGWLQRIDTLQSLGSVGPFASDQLIGALKSYIHQPSAEPAGDPIRTPSSP